MSTRETKLHQLVEIGQSPWLDYIRRDLIESGELAKMIETHALRGVTSNPAIFEKAINGSDLYRDSIVAGAREGLDPVGIYEKLAIEDVSSAADVLRLVYDSAGGADGFVSLEVSPFLARDTQGTIEEALRLWKAVDRPNLMIKVPATLEGVPAIERLIAEGVNVNVTLLFGIERYRAVAWAFVRGLETRAAKGLSTHIHSVASFFVSRVDSLLDPKLPQDLRGKVAIANAAHAYAVFLEIFESERFSKLEGAPVQRLLWASTSTKNPSYDDVMYVNELVAPRTVNTMPLETMEAFLDHGKPVDQSSNFPRVAADVLERAKQAGVDFEQMADQLENEAISKFAQPFQKLLEAIRASSPGGGSQTLRVGAFEPALEKALADMQRLDFMKRLWNKDGSLFGATAEEHDTAAKFMGWLDAARDASKVAEEATEFAAQVREDGFERAVVCGMGGSSLAPLVFSEVFRDAGGLTLEILDSTDPDTVLAVLESGPLVKTLFVISSKSGTTAEPEAFLEFFWEKSGKKGEQFVAITDPGSHLEKLAKERGFRKVFSGEPSIGGRYSALSPFGLVPAALTGADVKQLCQRAAELAGCNGPDVEPRNAAAIRLGAAWGELAKAGRNKLTLLVSRSLGSYGLWLEQLVAESTGKQEMGILPVANEAPGEPEVYGDDRFFFGVLMAGEDDPVRDALKKLAEAGHPVACVELSEPLDLGAEMVRAELATAVAGAIIGINPFDQPNVEEAKVLTREILEKVAKTGELTTPPESGPEAFSTLLQQSTPGDYVAILAYVHETPERSGVLSRLQATIRDQTHLAVTVGYGPRYLHSTGQFHKGGPNTGLFAVLVGGPERDAKIPGKPYSFATMRNAQAFGDLRALEARDRRVLLVNLGDDVAAGLARLNASLEA